MVTRGFTAYRYRGRVFHFFSSHDSYPESLGDSFANGVPKDPEDYRRWLFYQRKKAQKWFESTERFLCRRQADVESNVGINNTFEIEGFWDDHGIPKFEPLACSTFIEHVYTFDLDKEVFTVDNGAHSPLANIPPNWIAALHYDSHGNSFFAPGIVPEGTIANLVIQQPLEPYMPHNPSIVKARGLDTIPPAQQPAARLRTKLFRCFGTHYEFCLSAALLSWTSEDFLFRELAYTILCLASPSLKISLIPSDQLLYTGLGYANLVDDKGSYEEFVANLAVGAHLEGYDPGSSPGSKMYWFDGALVSIVAQLDKRYAWAVAGVTKYCQDKHSRQRVNAVCLSIEHVVLLRIDPGGETLQTELLPLVNIPHHTSMDVKARYLPQYLQKLRSKALTVKRAECQDSPPTKRLKLEDDGLSDLDEEEEHGDIYQKAESEITDNTTFIAVTRFLEASSRQDLMLSRPNTGVLPYEIYRGIIRYTNLQTRRICMLVSSSFRDLCQEQEITWNGIFERGTYTQNLTVPCTDVDLMRDDFDCFVPDPDERWEIVVGSEQDRRSVLPFDITLAQSAA